MIANQEVLGTDVRHGSAYVPHITLGWACRWSTNTDRHIIGDCVTASSLTEKVYISGTLLRTVISDLIDLYPFERRAGGTTINELSGSKSKRRGHEASIVIISELRKKPFCLASL